MEPDSPQGEEQLPVAERIAYLIAGFLRNSLTEEEHDELDAWIVESKENTKLFEELTNESNIEAGIDWYKQLDQKRSLDTIKERVGLKKSTKAVFQRIWPYLIAASLLTAIISIYLISKKKPNNHGMDLVDKKYMQLIQPGKDQAVLTLANGRTVILDSTGSGMITNEDGVIIEKAAGGEITYSGNTNEMRYNIVSTPRGGQYKLVLGDGTKVWLNAESSLKFPAGFAPDRRNVELRGEAYFEVAKHESKPFIVNIITPTGSEIVEVLGTHFNVNSYGDEGMVKTTLLEGSVRIQKDGKNVILRPGEQAQSNSEIKIVHVEADEEVAWKNGVFAFRDAAIKTIGWQIARWYDLEIEYRGTIPYHFTATIDRKEPLQTLLKLLEGTKRVHFKVDGKKLIIEP